MSAVQIATDIEPRELRLGVLLDARLQERWVLEALKQALAQPGVTLAAVAVGTGCLRPSLAGRLHRSFDRLDMHMRCQDEKLFAPVDVVSMLRLPALEFTAEHGKAGWHPDDHGAAGLRACGVDLWLCFCGEAPGRQIASILRGGPHLAAHDKDVPRGVWGLEIGPGVPATSPWAGAMEVASRSPITSMTLVNYADQNEGLLYRTFGATVRNSARLNRLDCLRKGVGLFGRLLGSLREEEALDDGLADRAMELPAHYPALPEPTVLALGRLSWRLLFNVAANQASRIFWRPQWQIAYRFLDEAHPDRPLERLRYLIPPKDRFWADPFAVEHEGRYFIFFEELPYDTARGRIMAVEVLENGEPGEPQVALEENHHLSYPFVFRWQDSLYMLPEGAESGLLQLYRCEEFPGRWKPCRVLLRNISAYDATLWQAGDRWWMFVNVAEPGASSSDELHLYWSSSPLGPWIAHPRNPVISDVRHARCAGPLFTRQGQLYRLSQDCSVAYGHSVWINRVDVLDEKAYRETAVRRIEPGWRRDVLRIHTLGAAGRLQVLDYLVNRKQRFQGFAAALRRPARPRSALKVSP